MRKAKFRLYRDVADEWRFRIVAGNGEISGGGEGYITEQGAIKGALLVKAISPAAPVWEEGYKARVALPRFEVYLDRATEWRWRLVARNGEIVASSMGEAYPTRAGAREGAEAVRAFAADAEISKDDDEG